MFNFRYIISLNHKNVQSEIANGNINNIKNLLLAVVSLLLSRRDILNENNCLCVCGF